MKLSLSQLAELTGGRLLAGGDIEVTSVVIDSREAKDDSVFFAIRGERQDGHAFLPQALEKARGAVVSTPPEQLPEGKGFVQVDDTIAALQRLARELRARVPFLLIGITGSAGKTTTKEMIATLVETEKKTWKSLGNFNNHIGFPLSLSNMPDGTEVVVSEMGMSAKGEIAFLAQLSHPNIGVYTNIKPVHLEFFGSIDGIAAAKRELLENLAADGIVILNADDPKVMQISEGFPGRKVLYSVNAPAEYRAAHIIDRGLLGTEFVLEAESDRRSLRLTLPGRHNLENLLAAIATARTSGISWKGIEEGIGKLKPAYHRGVIVPWRGAVLYDDTYNSNPYALGRTLELLARAEAKGRKIAVIGDMLELGPDELKFHYESGRSIPRDVDVVVGVGKRSESVLAGARDAGFDPSSLHHFDDAASATPFVRDLIRDGDFVLLKASRGIGLDKIIDALAEDEAGTLKS